MRVNLFIKPDLLEEADREAIQGGISRSALVRMALREYLDRARQAREEEERRRVRYEASERIERLARRLGRWDPVRAIRMARGRRRRVA